MSNKCPICQKDDQLTKASAIVQGGTHHISGQVPVSRTYQDSNGLQEKTTYESYHATQQTSLAQKLTPPEQPKIPPKPTFYGAIMLGALLLAAIASGIQDRNPDMIPAVILFGIGTAIFVFRYLKAASDYPKIIASANYETKRWEYAMNRWNQLYYCHRDDCVFVAGDTRYSDSSKTREYLYQS